VTGLRREEVALLTEVSVDYYVRLERGNLSGASDSVLDALARALQLDDAEHEHLFDLARINNAARAKRKATPSRTRIKRVVAQLQAAITDAAADVRNERGDIIAANKTRRRAVRRDPRRDRATTQFRPLHLPQPQSS